MNKRKYKVNDDFFEVINTEEKAYILGFIAADGNVRKKKDINSFVLRIGLSSKDETLLKTINTHLSNYPIRKYKTKYGFETIELSITSTKIYNDLNKLGIVERKSLILKFPENLPQELLPHFIRGYFDGDGSVYTYDGYIQSRNKSYNIIQCQIIGTKEFLTKLSEIMNFCGNQVKKETRLDTNCYKYSITHKKRCSELYKYLYKDATIYLERKKLIFENYFKKDVQRL